MESCKYEVVKRWGMQAFCALRAGPRKVLAAGS
jgi:hypothetical protein